MCAPYMSGAKRVTLPAARGRSVQPPLHERLFKLGRGASCAPFVFCRADKCSPWGDTAWVALSRGPYLSIYAALTTRRSWLRGGGGPCLDSGLERQGRLRSCRSDRLRDYA